MYDVQPSPAVIVGVDGSAAASSAAVWAVDEAASRNLLLKLVHVIHQADVEAAVDADTVAHDALTDALHAVEEAVAEQTHPLRVETEVLRGNPLATLIELSRSAAMVSVGALGVAHTCHHAGSTAAALAGCAECPVAVIHQRPVGRHAGRIVAEVDAAPENVAVLGLAMAEASLRDAALQVITALPPDRLEHRITHWTQHYPEVRVESISRLGDGSEDHDALDDITRYLAEHGESIQLFVSGVRDRRSLGFAGDIGSCSVLTVGGGRSW